MKKNVLFVISQLYKGGAEISLVNLLKKLDYDLLNVDLLIINQNSDKDNISLIKDIPDTVNICNAFAENQRYSLLKKIRAKYLYKKGINYYPRPALDFVRNKSYDFAFHIGEWYSPEFVAIHVSARQKAAWIHTDISRSVNFDEETFFKYFDYYDYYIFASRKSMESGLERYEFMRDKACVIYNISDADQIRFKSSQSITDYEFDPDILTVVTCANVRPEKNYSRQIEAMHILNNRGIRFKWLNIGAHADVTELNKVNLLIKEYKLENDFILLGTRDNPYKYMKHATAVAVLSDYESWSMVITEAKILGVPVIATKTSGALEQIEHRITGMLTDFDASDIADKLEELIINKELQLYIRKNIRNFDNTQEILDSFYRLLNSNPASLSNDIIYIIDDINYNGGAHSATIKQIDYLISSGRQVAVFSTTTPNIELRTLMQGVQFLSWHNIREDKLFNERLFFVLSSKNFNSAEKKFKLLMTYRGRICKDINVFNTFVMPGLSNLFSRYKTVVVMSEASVFRAQAAHCNAPKKIQWIHTDYSLWSKWNDWTKEITKNDGELYNSFTNIVLLSETIRSKFIACYPSLAEKTTVIKNFLPCEEIIKKSRQRNDIYPKLKFITVGRLSPEKSILRLVDILHKLDDENYDFSLDIIGDGPEWELIKNRVEHYGLNKKINMLGLRSNPYTFIKQADVFLLLSEYEGLPNTIYESLILGIPVLATKVGGIPEQINEGENGWLVDNNFDAIYNKIKYVIEHHEEVETYKNNLKSYKYDNEEIYYKVIGLF